VICRFALWRIDAGSAVGVGKSEDFATAIACVARGPVREVQRASSPEVECLDVLRCCDKFIAVTQKAVRLCELVSGRRREMAENVLDKSESFALAAVGIRQQQAGGMPHQSILLDPASAAAEPDHLVSPRSGKSPVGDPFPSQFRRLTLDGLVELADSSPVV
jgi:hypothetical protein